MKLRIKGNSLRCRVSQNELKLFGETGSVSDTIEFPGNSLRFGLIRTRELQVIRAGFEDNSILIHIPAQLADGWVSSEEVGFSVEQALASGNTLSILVEKDFKCLHRANVDESDLFPHPGQKTSENTLHEAQKE